MIDKNILDFLNLFDDDYIISLSNKGYLKRAKKDLEKIRGDIKIINESPLELQIQENKVIFKGTKTEEIECTCPDSKFCRHRIVSIFYIKENYENNSDDTLEETTEPEEINYYDNYKELLDLNLKSLEKKFTKAKFIKGVKYFLSSSVTEDISANSLSFIFKNDFNDEVVKFSFRGIEPLVNNNCDNVSCKGKKGCEHNIASLLHYLLNNNIIKTEEISELVKKDLKPIDENLLKEVEDVFLEIINLGLTKITSAIAIKIKKLAFRIHYEVPAFEKLMNGVERDLNSFLNKNPKFNLEDFRNKLIRFFRILRLYRADKSNYQMIDKLTRFRSEYIDVKEIQLNGVGKEYLEIGDNAILKTYFLSSDNRVFTRSLFVSLKSEDNYSDPKNKLHFMPLWEGFTTDAFLNKKVIIKRTKINGDLVISSVLSSISIKENHNFKDLASYNDFSKLKIEYLKFRKENALLNINYTPFYALIKPFDYGVADFNYENQTLVIDIYDENRNEINLKFRYGDVSKRYQNKRKQVFDKIISEFESNKNKPFLIFGKPFIDNKEFFINVISFYYEHSHKVINPNIDWEIK